MPAVCVLAYMAALVANNYCENRFLLKSGVCRGPTGGPPKQFGFRFVPPAEAQSGDEEGNEE